MGVDRVAAITELRQYSEKSCVLYVEDIREIREDTAEILKKFFKVVDTAENGRAGLQAYGGGFNYDIVISDIKMPELDGIEMAKEMKRINPDQVLVITTAFNDYQNIAKLFNLGFDKFLVKPMDIDNMLSVLLDVSKRVYFRKEYHRSRLLGARLSAMNEILSNIAHHWRQPLNAVGLNIQEMRYLFEHGELTKEGMEELAASSMATLVSMSETIDKFSECFKVRQSKDAFSIGNAVNDAIFITRHALAANDIEVIKDFEQDFTLKGSQIDLTNVVLEIICNGIEAMYDKTHKNYFIKIRIAEKDGKPNILITNNGPLIKDEVFDKLSDPYFSSKHVSAGSGLGLYFAKMIVEHNLGGVLSYRNAGDCVEFGIRL